MQWIFDTASEMSINRRGVVGNTIARDGTYRSVSRGNSPKVFTITLPPGLPWSEYYTDIEAAEALDRHTSSSIEIKYDSFPWFYGNVDPVTNDTYNLICIEFPEWTIFDRNLVSWNGPFIFVEDIV